MDIVFNQIIDYLNVMLSDLRLISIIILVLFIGLRKVFTKYIFTWIIKIANKTETGLDEKILQAFEKPLSFAILALGIYLALLYWPLSSPQYILVNKIFRSLVIFIVAWGLYNLTGSHSNFSEEIKVKLKIDDILIQFFSKVVRFIIVVLAILMIAQEFNYDVNGFVAGLGLGGLAFALAAKDALANVFGGIVIILEKPFSIGDWIKTPVVEGTIEEISFRSTKIRAFDQALITVPNMTLANDSITNYTRMGKRRISFHLGVTYSTSVLKLEKCVNRIKDMLENHEDVHPETIMVFFERFNDSSLDIFLYFFTNTTVWKEYLAVKQDINFKIMQILEEEGVSVAFPSHSIYLENTEGLKYLSEHVEVQKNVSLGE